MRHEPLQIQITQMRYEPLQIQITHMQHEAPMQIQRSRICVICICIGANVTCMLFVFA
jgi:hypothetical protein